MANKMKPVKQVELSEQRIGLRIAVVAILIVVAVASFAYGISSFFTPDEGWTEIHANSSADVNLSGEFVFMYNLGSRNDMSVVAENKSVISIYTDAMVKAYQLFHTNQSFEGVNNMLYINQHPNEEIEVDELLYNALSLIQKYGDRKIYLAPIYEHYDDIFYCEDDSQTLDYDPYKNSEVAAYYKEIADFAVSEDNVNIQLCGDNKIILYVSDTYEKYCKENDITRYIDFSWMTNGFVTDYVADVLIDNGYTAGCISSYDGFVRNLDESDVEFSLNIFQVNEESVYQAAVMQYSGSKSFVAMRNFPINTLDEYRYYVLNNGEIRTLYLDETDGMCKNSVDSLYAYSKEESCAELLLQVDDLYIADILQEQAVRDMQENEIYFIYVQENEIIYSDKDLKLTGLYKDHTTRYIME